MGSLSEGSPSPQTVDHRKEMPLSSAGSSQSTRLIIRAQGAERCLEFSGDLLTIGRSQDNQVEIDDISSSRQHCRLKKINGNWHVEDLRSRNGTLVNGILIRKQLLQAGDCIEIGKTQIYFLRVPTSEISASRNGETLLLPTDYFMEPIDSEMDESSGVQVERLAGEREIFLRLIEISKNLCSILNLDELLEVILDNVIQITGAERGFIILEEENGLAVAASRNIDRETVKQAQLKVSQSVVRHVIEEGRSVLVGEASKDPVIGEFESVAELRLEAVLCVPLKLRGSVHGVVYVDNRFEPDFFHTSQLRFIEFLADQAVIFIENARLFEEDRRRQEQVRKSKEEVDNLNRDLQAMLIAKEVEPDQVNDLVKKGARPNLRFNYDRIVTRSSKMYQVFEMLDRVICTDIPVLIQGESGTGKELVAHAVHYQGTRHENPFISQNCAAIPPNLLESEFFGHMKGSFTGAVRDKKGLFELADNGTLFLDEIGDMSLDLQTKLLRVLEEGEVRPVGGREVKKVDVRIVSATNRELEKLVREGNFREDLYYRLNVFNIALPPLRERREDIPLLVDHFIDKVCSRTGRDRPEVDRRSLYYLFHSPWPGNVRQLENEIERLVALAEGSVTPDLLSPSVVSSVQGAPQNSQQSPSGNLKEMVGEATEELERRVLGTVLDQNRWNKSQTARQLGISRPTLDQKIDKYGMKRPDKRAQEG